MMKITWTITRRATAIKNRIIRLFFGLRGRHIVSVRTVGSAGGFLSDGRRGDRLDGRPRRRPGGRCWGARPLLLVLGHPGTHGLLKDGVRGGPLRAVVPSGLLSQGSLGRPGRGLPQRSARAWAASQVLALHLHHRAARRAWHVRVRRRRRRVRHTLPWSRKVYG